MAINYPESRTSVVIDEYFGQKIEDKFRWLEGDESGNMTEEVAEWTDQQNNFTRDFLDNLKGRKRLEERIRPLMEIDTISMPHKAGENVFYAKREGKQNQPCFYYRKGVWGEEKLLLDPNKLDESGLLAIPWISPSKDGSLMAYGSYLAGDENTTLNLIEVETGKTLSDQITGKVGGVYWMPDNSGFLYSKLANVSNPYSRIVCFHKLGDKQENDAILFEQYKEGPYAETWGPFGELSKDGKWLILGYHTSTRSNDLWIANFETWLKEGKLEKQVVVEGEKCTTMGEIVNGRLFIFTNDNADNGCLFVADPNKPEKANWSEFVPEREDSVLDQFCFSKSRLIITYQKNASSYLEQFAMDGKSLGLVELPGIGSASCRANTESDEVFVAFTSFNVPSSYYLNNLETGESKLWDRIKVPIDPDSVEVSQKWFESNDGTKVSMFVIHKKGIELNGQNPTLVYGYGGFGISMTPGFNLTNFPWFEAGGVYVVVNLRGGNEYGDGWHRAGMQENKERVFEDLESACEWLIDNKYTCCEKLSIMGGSNGGLLTGAAVTRRPDLYKAVVIGVPLLDMLRFHKFLMAKFWVPEYGSSEVEQEFKTLLAYSPYHNVRPGTKYPAVFLTSGENDTRVHPLHARKMAAALQEATASDTEKEPVLLWVDRKSGHGAGKPLDLRLCETVDKWIFIMWQLGMLEGK